MGSVLVNALQRGEWGPGNLCSSLHPFLQEFTVHGSRAPVPELIDYIAIIYHNFQTKI